MTKPVPMSVGVSIWLERPLSVDDATPAVGRLAWAVPWYRPVAVRDRRFGRSSRGARPPTLRGRLLLREEPPSRRGQYWKSSSRYLGSGQRSSATSVSSSSATSRSAFWAGMTSVDEGPRLRLHGARLVGGVLGVLERVDGVDQRVGAGRATCSATARDALATTGAAAARPGTRTAAGRIIVLAMSSAQLASMLLTLT